MLMVPARPMPSLEDRRVWSIRQVYEESAKVFVEGSNTIQNIIQILMRLVIMGESPNAFLNVELAEEVSKQVEFAETLFEKMGARATRDACKRTMEYLETPAMNPVRVSEIMISLQAIKSSYYDELASWHVLFLNEREAAIFDHGETEMFGQEVVDAFPSAVPYMIESCKCFALGRWTASTYHCMGVVEVGIKALCKELRAQIDLDSYDTTWDRMCSKIMERLTPPKGRAQGRAAWAPRRRSKPRTWGQDEAFFNACVVDIRNIKASYRNPLMHFRVVFNADDRQSKRVLESTGAFMRYLSERVKE